eukprot:TRINITY_DN16580_c0_g1_i1.p1 TRINITY_DN16580_c0_g1~~TRINITY_DN16580_c0_g1_i1.p1  ORF type:complete len:303 (-),score=55.31 TRINITY_DN16580_c0_g1_i1:299-1159(-)
MASYLPPPGEPAFIVMPTCLVESGEKISLGGCRTMEPSKDKQHLLSDRSAAENIMNELLVDLASRNVHSGCAVPLKDVCIGNGVASRKSVQCNDVKTKQKEVSRTEMQVSSTSDSSLASHAETTPSLISPAMNDCIAALTCSVPDIVRLAARGDVETVSELLRRGVDVNIKDDFGLTSLHEAAKKGRCQMVKLLVDWRAEVNASAKMLHGETPLHYASKYGRIDVLRVLVNSRADMQCKTDQGQTPLQLACSKGQRAAEEILKNEVSLPCHAPDIVRHVSHGVPTR